MTNEEKARELGDRLINAVGHTVKDRKEIIDITNEMIEWKEQQMIEKAVEWLKERAEHYYGVEGEYSNKVGLIFCKEELLEDFKEAMMED